TMGVPSVSAAFSASPAVVARNPRGVGTPYFRNSSLPWYSWIFIEGSLPARPGLGRWQGFCRELRRHFKVKTSTVEEAHPPPVAPGMSREPPERRRWTGLALLALATGLVSIPWSGHVDDVDAQFYRVVTRHMVQDDTWLRLRFLPRLFPTFRE